MKINVSKSHYIRIGNRCIVKCANIATRSGLDLDWIEEIHYLETYIKISRHFKCSFNKARSSFYRAVNAIFSKLRHSNERFKYTANVHLY